MYQITVESLSVSIEKSLDYAVSTEFGYRHEKEGGVIAFSPFSDQKRDTSRYITKTIRTVDTSFVVNIDKYDGRSTEKIAQFLLKHNAPINLAFLDSIFRINIKNEFPTINNSYIDYINIKSNSVIGSSYTDIIRRKDNYISSKLYPLDIAKSIGIKAYVKNPASIILKRMLFLLIVSGILIAITFYALFYLLKSFLFQKKENKMRQDAIYSMTHEFKRPISSAITQTALIPYYLERNDEKRIVQYTDNILLELNKLTTYTERIQKISNNNTELTLDKTDVVLVDFFHQVCDKYRHITEKDIRINLNIQTQEEMMKVDLLHISNVIDNLIENAIKYSTEFLMLDIKITDIDNHILIQLKDNGIGIPKLDINNIFNKYYRSSNVKASQPGFGLGLTYCKHIIQAHRGTISVKSQIGIGSEFSLLLPIK